MRITTLLQRSQFPAVEIFLHSISFHDLGPKPPLADLLRVLSRKWRSIQPSASTEEMKARHGYAAAAITQVRSAECPDRHGSFEPQRTFNGRIGLADVIGKIKTTILIGLSTAGGAFTEADGA